MSRLTIVNTITYSVEMEVPLGFLIDADLLAREQEKGLKEAVRASTPEDAKLLSVGVHSTVIPGRVRW
ncbi:hypothetical protein KGG77_gp50 [Streptomyces phage Omar]|uniref:Uncharacterized protein n=1 Tax=Streptomyces phage Omar TaxID=2059882 RepID=A0A2H5BLK3_9CAUD|nr:hypothetical protein KGG77_gp50 [Streptomyces phage Omar]AUG87218.1 hypothetical protein SEA_OMAR_34 [Streptomyces phage Omar]